MKELNYELFSDIDVAHGKFLKKIKKIVNDSVLSNPHQPFDSRQSKSHSDEKIYKKKSIFKYKSLKKNKIHI